MQALLKHWTDALLGVFGLSSASEKGWDLWVSLLLVLLIVVLFDFVCRLTLARGMRRIVERTHVKWDDDLFSLSVLNHSCHVLSAILLSITLPVVFEDNVHIRTLLNRLMQSYIIVTVCRLLCAVIRAGFRMAVRRPAWQNKPIKGLRQTAQGIVVLISTILIISILIGKSPTYLLTGLGASAAVLMLIFKDSILGFVSGIQLSVNDMLQVGDWIEMPKYGVNGVVIEVTLTTVKVRNYDNTVVTVPPYLLVSDSFQNWQAMKRSGGRRVMRSVFIDLSTVRFCTPDMLARFRRTPPRVEVHPAKVIARRSASDRAAVLWMTRKGLRRRKFFIIYIGMIFAHSTPMRAVGFKRKGKKDVSFLLKTGLWKLSFTSIYKRREKGWERNLFIMSRNALQRGNIGVGICL